MVDYKTPDVYTVEKSTLPSSVVTGASAIPAFVGYTEKAKDSNDRSLTNVPTRINSMREYENKFGQAVETEFKVEINSNTEVVSITENPGLTHLMYHSLQLYFANGGGACYIVSVGSYKTKTPAYTKLKAGLELLEKEDEPTLLLPGDAAKTGSYHTYVQDMLTQCSKTQDRFALIDMDGNNADAFRTAIGSNYLNYGAAYYPNLNTNLPYKYVDTGTNAVKVTIYDGVGDKPAAIDLSVLNTPINSDKSKNDDYNPARYRAVKDLLDRQRVTLPPSAALAGAIVTTDNETRSLESAGQP